MYFRLDLLKHILLQSSGRIKFAIICIRYFHENILNVQKGQIVLRLQPNIPDPIYSINRKVLKETICDYNPQQ